MEIIKLRQKLQVSCFFFFYILDFLPSWRKLTIGFHVNLKFYIFSQKSANVVVSFVSEFDNCSTIRLSLCYIHLSFELVKLNGLVEKEGLLETILFFLCVCSYEYFTCYCIDRLLPIQVLAVREI